VTPGLLIGIGLLGGVGAVARFLVDGTVATRVVTEFPLGTFVVNLSGAFAIGLVAGAALDDDAYRLLAVGLLGGYSTFSTWMYESQRLGEDGELRLGIVNFVASLVLGLVAVWLGRGL
jgi:fluoride exporter